MKQKMTVTCLIIVTLVLGLGNCECFSSDSTEATKNQRSFINPQTREQCRATLGNELRLTQSGMGILSIEDCAWARISKHTMYAGEYLGLIAAVSPDAKPFQLNDNTFVDYEDGTTGRNWVVWFPDRKRDDYLLITNGTQISIEIDMPGMGKGEAYKRDISGIAAGYGSMLFIQGQLYLNWNMAYTNSGRSSKGSADAGMIELNVTEAPSTGRFLLLFPKHASKVKSLSIGGQVFSLSVAEPVSKQTANKEYDSTSVSIHSETTKKATAKVFQVSGTVVAVDGTAKTLLVKGKKGEVVFKADDKSAAKLCSIKVGDKVTVKYKKVEGENVATSISRDTKK